MKLRFTPRATEDIKAIADYIRERDPAAAVRVRSAIYDSLGRLLLFPRLGRLQLEPGVRKLVTRFDYLIYYLVENVDEEVVVQHPARERDHDDA